MSMLLMGLRQRMAPVATDLRSSVLWTVRDAACENPWLAETTGVVALAHVDMLAKRCPKEFKVELCC